MMRTARATDGELLETIHRAAFGDAQSWSAAFIVSQMELPGTFAILEEAGGFILARCILEQAEILTLAVAPGSRRRGVASGLLALMLVRVTDLGARAVFLEVSERNAPAQALYRAHGYTQVGTRPGYYDDGAAALVMSLALGNASPITGS